jgi:hypothetical protein
MKRRRCVLRESEPGSEITVGALVYGGRFGPPGVVVQQRRWRVLVAWPEPHGKTWCLPGSLILAEEAGEAEGADAEESESAAP